MIGEQIHLQLLRELVQNHLYLLFLYLLYCHQPAGLSVFRGINFAEPALTFACSNLKIFNPQAHWFLPNAWLGFNFFTQHNLNVFAWRGSLTHQLLLFKIYFLTKNGRKFFGSKLF